MAYEDFSPPRHLPALPHPLAKPGFGKRSAPGQRPARPADFAHLPRREASVAAYLDRLPEGADISVKTLAKVLADYGQCALRTVRRRLSEAGHLRQFTEHLMSDDGSQQWVTRTYFSRTPRDDAWWAALRAGNVPTAGTPSAEGPQEEPPDPPEDEPSPRPQRPYSRAYALLAALGRAEPRMTLSAADCAALEAYAEEWLARGASREQVLTALTAGLPPQIHHPGRLAHRRLVDKMPPVTVEAARDRPLGPNSTFSPCSPLGAVGPLDPLAPLRMMECTVCGIPGRPAALPGGICGACRGEAPPDRGPARTSPAQVRAHVRHLRAIGRATAPSGPQSSP
ncbi:hypothetical protein GCM10010211_36010 [Streptomyces albospinus]|uniref:Uncharacterized protein n=1 Tax=Streptomyces albospinus TaxID=285515 RepID=A0ABQ2V3M8_9ACTN|nr:hypothetical protein [Streptomyces albospinus]GGU67497.1 hypothetical protein GCM10010211_36010 [Streptomyces albospinus]